MKVCTKCGESKPLGAFYKDARNCDGLTSWCQRCRNDIVQEWKRAHPQRVQETKHAWYARNREDVIRRITDRTKRRRFEKVLKEAGR